MARANPGVHQGHGSRDRAARFLGCNPSSTWNLLERNSIQAPENKSGQAKPTRESGFPRRTATGLPAFFALGEGSSACGRGQEAIFIRKWVSIRLSRRVRAISGGLNRPTGIAWEVGPSSLFFSAAGAEPFGVLAGASLFRVVVHAAGDRFGGFAFPLLDDQPLTAFRGGEGETAFALGDFELHVHLTSSPQHLHQLRHFWPPFDDALVPPELKRVAVSVEAGQLLVAFRPVPAIAGSAVSWQSQPVYLSKSRERS